MDEQESLDPSLRPILTMMIWSSCSNFNYVSLLYIPIHEYELLHVHYLITMKMEEKRTHFAISGLCVMA